MIAIAVDIGVNKKITRNKYNLDINVKKLREQFSMRPSRSAEGVFDGE